MERHQIKKEGGLPGLKGFTEQTSEIRQEEGVKEKGLENKASQLKPQHAGSGAGSGQPVPGLLSRANSSAPRT